jgi:hypothetical protein
MMELRNMLIIGGASRNVGKTELVCGLIRRFGSEREIVSLKISGINPGSDPLHGDHGPPPEKFHLLEETSKTGQKDSSKMLISGASRSFYLRTGDEHTMDAMDYFFSVVDPGSVIICESIMLRRFIRPGLFVMIRSNREESVKKSLGEVLHLIDLTILSDGIKFMPPASVICLDESGWHLCRQQG